MISTAADERLTSAETLGGQSHAQMRSRPALNARESRDQKPKAMVRTAAETETSRKTKAMTQQVTHDQNRSKQPPKVGQSPESAQGAKVMISAADDQNHS